MTITFYLLITILAFVIIARALGSARMFLKLALAFVVSAFIGSLIVVDGQASASSSNIEKAIIDTAKVSLGPSIDLFATPTRVQSVYRKEDRTEITFVNGSTSETFFVPKGTTSLGRHPPSVLDSINKFPQCKKAIGNSS